MHRSRNAGRLPRTSALAIFTFIGIGLVGPRAADAQDVELRAIYPEAPSTPVADDDGEAKTADKAEPFIRATIVSDRIGLTAKEFVLKLEEAEPKVAVEARRAVTYPNSDEPMALVILIQGDLAWMGNDTYSTGEDDELDKLEGAFTGLPPAIEAFSTAGPKGSRAAVVVYADAAVFKQSMSDLSKLSGTALGTQQDYKDISKSLIVGLESAWKTLANEKDSRRVLVVMGNGEDTKEDVGPDLKRVIGNLKEARVESYSIHYTNSESAAQGLTNMNQIGYTRHESATSRDHFAAKAKNIVEIIGAKYYVDFAGEKFPWDGNEHNFIPSVGGEDLEEVAVKLEPYKFAKPSEGGLWWLWLIIVLAVVLVVVIIIVIARRKPAAAPPPAIIDVPPPEPAGPKKTVMFNLNAGSEYPVVGWIVPLSGPNQFQTFKLLQGATKIGTGGESHIIINDGFMSTVHAQIVCKQSGFVLVDGGSTNGSFVNDRKIAEHELVDNDQFLLGKTPFKFKSIN